MLQPVHIFIDPYFTQHQNGYGHPENPKRIQALLEMLETYRQDSSIQITGLDPSQVIDPLLVHQADYLQYLKKSVPQENTLFLLDEDTVIGSQSLSVALAGLQMMQQGIQSVFESAEAAFVMTRPPGHHARPDLSMGFCVFNNIAYAAQYARKAFGIQRIAIVDWDVHHFNGTEEMFYTDLETYTISLHQYPHWPHGYGWVDRRGEGSGLGYNLNIPMPKEAGDWQVIEMFERFVLPQLEVFEPELILVSAGFDSHRLERNSGLGTPSVLAYTEYAYSFMTFMLSHLAQKHAHGRIMFALEGGYYLPSLQSGAQAVIQTLQTDAFTRDGGFTTGEGMDQALWENYKAAVASSLSTSNH